MGRRGIGRWGRKGLSGETKIEGGGEEFENESARKNARGGINESTEKRHQSI